MDRAHGLVSCAAAALLLTSCLGPGTTRPTRLFVLNATALVKRLHCTQNAAAFTESLELLEHGVFNEIGQLLNDERALRRILVLGKAEFFVDDQLDRHRPAHRLFRRCGNRFIVRIRV